MNAIYHETLARSPALIEKLRSFPITVCGAGALGANIIESLARAGCGTLRVIDRDRIEERNLSTQPYYRSDIGAFKAKILLNAIFRAVAVSVDARAKELSAANVGQLLAGSSLVIDAFDNSLARSIVSAWCAQSNTPCLHAGLANGYAEVIWNERYRVPSAANDDVCDYPLARNLVMLAVVVACESAISFVGSGVRRNFTITLADLAVRELL